jgi:hypothetical protein
MNVQKKIVYIFNKFLINFLKAIKKENYFKVAIKKHYKVIDKNSNKYIKSFTKKLENFTKLLCTEKLELSNLLDNDDFTNLNILKNINIGRLFKVFKSEEDSNTVLSYILTLYLLSMFYLESIKIHEKLMNFVNNKENILDENEVDENEEDEVDEVDENEEDEVDEVDENEVDEDENEVDEDEDEVDEEDEDEVEEDEEDEDEVDEEDELNNLLMKSLNIINDSTNNELSEIIDDDIRNVLHNIINLKTNIIAEDGENNNLDDLIGDSKIGQLAKEISSQIDVDSLNLDINNPSELLNPANLFGGENGNILGNLVQQVGSSITEKMNSGELNQQDLVKDAFSLMNKMQSNSSGNPILDNMMGNMMGNQDGGGMDINEMMKNMMGGQGDNSSSNNTSSSDNGGGMDINEMMKNMMGNQDMMQQMMNSMGGTQSVNQNNPNSREGKAKERLRKKLAAKNNN